MIYFLPAGKLSSKIIKCFFVDHIVSIANSFQESYFQICNLRTDQEILTLVKIGILGAKFEMSIITPT